MRRLARALGCTEGQMETLLIGLVLAVALTAITVTGVAGHRPPAPAAPIPFVDLSRDPAATPLKIVDGGYASANPGTPEPAGGLPVARDAGGDSRHSFVRLDGQAAVLHLAVMGAPDVARSEASARIEMCPISSADWRPAQDIPLAAEPAHNCGLAVVGQRHSDGSWTFDLGAFSRTAPEGFAIVPAPDATGSFSVTFSTATLRPVP